MQIHANKRLPLVPSCFFHTQACTRARAHEIDTCLTKCSLCGLHAVQPQSHAQLAAALCSSSFQLVPPLLCCYHATHGSFMEQQFLFINCDCFLNCVLMLTALLWWYLTLVSSIKSLCSPLFAGLGRFPSWTQNDCRILWRCVGNTEWPWKPPSNRLRDVKIHVFLLPLAF